MYTTFQNLSTQALVHCIDDNLVEKSLSFPRFFGGEIQGPNPRWFMTGEAMPKNNGVVSAAFADGAIDANIDAIVEPFRARTLPLTWWVGPRTTPARLGRHLQAHGFTHNRDMIGMAMDLDRLDLPGNGQPTLRFEQVQDKATLLEWYTLLQETFALSHDTTYLDALAAISLRPGADWLHYVGRLDGNVITISSLFLGGGVAGLYNLGTTASARGQGIGTWMTSKTFDEARNRGYHVGTLQTTYPNALRMYHHMGFEVYCKIGIYNYHPKR